MQRQHPWRVGRALVDRVLANQVDKLAIQPLAVSPGSLSNPWPGPRLPQAVKCLAVLVRQVVARAWQAAPWVVAWAPLGVPWVLRVDPWVAWE